MDVLADGFTHLVACVGEKVLGFPQAALLRLKMELPAEGGDDASRVEDRRPGDLPFLDGPADTRARIVALVADIPHGGETGLQHVAGIDDSLDGPIRIRILQCRIE